MANKSPLSFDSLANLLNPPTPSALSMLGIAPPPASLFAALATPTYAHAWIAVTPRFTQFRDNLQLTAVQRQDGLIKRNGVVSCLNNAYYNNSSETENSFFVGSWAKDTAIRPPRDVDIYFLLPAGVHQRFQGYTWNRQSALLQEVKNLLAVTYPGTDMSGDGQVVVVNFGSYCVEVVPAFALVTPQQYWICNTHDGGSYKQTAPWHEVAQLDQADRSNNNNLRPLIRMLKAWQAHCSVPIKSFHLELLATEFIAQSPWRLNSFFYFDWITRDFFAFMQQRVNGYVLAPGTVEVMALGNQWESRALTAHQRAVKACEFEKDNMIAAAGDEWQKIFGPDIPRTV
jgi:hypothetical protein